MSWHDDLVSRAKQRAETGGIDESWGDLVELEEDESFTGRYRGSTTDPANDRVVYLFWSDDDEPCWSRYYAALGRELEQASPAIGDRIVIYRGANYKTAYDDEYGPKGRSFGVVCEPSDKPLPTEPAEAAPKRSAAGDSGIPF